ncbi:hypothetical protein BDV25DRAFT_28526 [Aspergillus avenaceus]|uniref:Uncharacterized protein n=1 Tax=Aspergillus avenaceus TaxID=36643 RepID=A0A5N6TNP4_ASPAV|nr:hypothetical protein BDV25DRAFT_28526 [Aspergillus avenaceus]
MSVSRLSVQSLRGTLATCRLSGRLHLQSPLQCRFQSTSKVPRLAQASVWNSFIPKFLRNRGSQDTRSAKSKEWNPASFYIIIFILIGSQAIRMIALKNEYAAYTRSTDAKITLLREVIQRVKNGEKVDVERLLGTGDQAKEREWEEILREIEEEDSLWHRKSKKEEAERQAQAEEQRTVESTREKDPVIPAEGDANQEPADGSRSKRNLNFF